MAGAHDGGAAAASHADHLRDQPQVLTASRGPVAGGQREDARHVHHRGVHAEDGADGAPRDRGLARRQRRGGDSHQAGQVQAVSRV